MSKHRSSSRYALSQEFSPETKLVIIPEENASSNNQLDLSKQSYEEKQITNENETEQQPPKRKTVIDLVKDNEKRIQQYSAEKSKIEHRFTIRYKNREMWKEKLQKLKNNLKKKKEPNQEISLFYKSNKIGLEDIGVYSSKELGELLKQEDDSFFDYNNNNNNQQQLNVETSKRYFTEERSPMNFGLKETISPIQKTYQTRISPISKTKGIIGLTKIKQQPKIINYQQNIIASINSMSVPQYTLTSNLINDPSFLDVICINCYEIVKFNQMDSHSEKCIAPPIEGHVENENVFDDCNSRMYKMYSSLKERSDEYLNAINENLIKFYKTLLKLVYQILINNNSIEELDECSFSLNELLNNTLVKISGRERAIFDIFCRRIVQLIYIKTIELRKLFCYKSNDKTLNQILSEDNSTNSNSNSKIIHQRNDSNIPVLQLQSMSQVHPQSQPQIQSQIGGGHFRVSSHARIFSAHALSEIYSDVESKQEDDYDEESAYTSQDNSITGHILHSSQYFQDIARGLHYDLEGGRNSTSVSERSIQIPKHQKYLSQDLSKYQLDN